MAWTFSVRSGTASLACGAGVLLLVQMAAATKTVQVGPNGALVFSPSAVTVNAGDTVDWQWMTGYHSTTGQQSPETWDSGVQYAPHTFSHTFMKPGTYPYFCSVHPKMTGKVVVQ